MIARVAGNDYRSLTPPELGAWTPSLRVSVVVPAYGGQDKLDLVLAGLAGQTYPEDLTEVIVVDNGSDPPLRLPDPGAPRPVPGAEFPVVFEDDSLLVVDKPAGVAVHGGSGVSFGVIEQLRAARPRPSSWNWCTGYDRRNLRPAGWSPRSASDAAGPDTPCCARAQRTSTITRWYEGDWVNDASDIKLSLSKWTTQSGERRVKVDPDGQTAHTIHHAQAALRPLQSWWTRNCAPGAPPRSVFIWRPAAFPSWATTSTAMTRFAPNSRAWALAACSCMPTN